MVSPDCFKISLYSTVHATAKLNCYEVCFAPVENFVVAVNATRMDFLKQCIEEKNFFPCQIITFILLVLFFPAESAQ